MKILVFLRGDPVLETNTSKGFLSIIEAYKSKVREIKQKPKTSSR